MSSFFKAVYSNKWRVPLIILGSGFLIRFLLMPVSGHLDLLLSSWREYLWAFKGVIKFNDLIEASLALYIKIFRSQLSLLPSLIDIPNSEGTLGLKEQATFLSSFRAWRYLFFFKLPFLMFDLASVYFIWKLFKDRAQKIMALAFWAFNPFLIFAVYVWGRYEIVPIVLTIVSLYFLKNQKNWLAILFLGLAIAGRMPFILLLPFYVIYLSKIKLDYLKYFIVGLLPLIVITKIIEIAGGTNIFSDAVQSGFADYLVRGGIGQQFGAIVPFLILYPLALYLYYRHPKVHDFKVMTGFSAIGLLIFFGTSYFHPQYLAWLSPVILITFVYNRKIAWAYLGMSAIYFVLMDIFYNRIASSLLFQPLGLFWDNFGGLRSQRIFYDFNAETLISIFHTLFVLTIGILIWQIYQKSHEN